MTETVSPHRPATSAQSPEPSPETRDVVGRPVAQQRLLDDMHQPVRETSAQLKACVRTSAALARLQASVQRSLVTEDFLDVSRRLEAIGALCLDGVSVDVSCGLSDEVNRLPSALRHALKLQEAAMQSLREERVDKHLLMSLASVAHGRDNPIRTRALGGRERRQLATGQRLINDATALEEGVSRWADFVERSAGDTEPLILLGAALRRWMLLRPFQRANAVIGMTLIGALLNEDLGSPIGLSLAWRFARFDTAFRDALATDEASWLVWWLGAIGTAAEEALASLLLWECEIDALEVNPLMNEFDLQARQSLGLCSVGFSPTQLASELGVTRHRARSIIDAFVGAGQLKECGSGGAARYAWRALQERLASPSLHLNIAM